MAAGGEVDNYISRAPDYAQPICKKLRAIIKKADKTLVEEIKWGAPAYTKNGLVCSIAAFKQDVAVWFHKGALLKDPKGILLHGAATAMRTVKFTSLDEIHAATVTAYVREAVKLNERGAKVEIKKKSVKVPPALKKALDGNKKAKAFFEGLAPSHRRAFADWVAQAKKAETRRRRIKQALAMMAKKEKIGDKYR